MKIKKRRKRGVWKWVVDQRGEKRGQKFFNTADDAEHYVSGLNLQAEAVGVVNILSAEQQVDAAHAIRILGNETSLSEAARYYSRSHQNKTMLVSKLVTEVTDSKESAKRRPEYVRALKRSGANLVKATSDCTLAEVVPTMIGQFMAKQNWAAKSKQTFCIDCRTIFSHAVKNNYILKNPISGIEWPSVDSKEIHIFTVDQCRELMTRVQSFRLHVKRHKTFQVQECREMICYYTLALFCGIRPMEIARLNKDDIDLDRKQIRVSSSASKTRRDRFVTISSNAAQWLAGEIKIPHGRSERHHARIRQGMTWHHDVLRHSFGSYHFAKFRSETLTTSEMGNSPSVFYDSYRKLVKPEDAELFWGILP